ncbi:MAG: MBOAT family O-acyltransferase [Thermoanaerobaculia bacterium]
MLFQSFPFLFVFLPVTLLLYWAGSSRVWRQSVLLVSSYIFYGYWDYRFCGLLLFSSVVDYVVGLQIERSGSPAGKRAWLLLSIATNLTLLGFFKYWDFFADSTNRVLSSVGMASSLPLFQIILPIGISFYTFQTMSYTIDVYRGKTQATRSLVKFLAFVSLFPQLVAGPIVRWTELDEQLDQTPARADRRAMALGMCFFIVGLFKKLCIADWMFPMVDQGLYEGMTTLQFWPAYLGWSFWLYYDFSSYSDMAVGLGLLFGIKLPMNFNSPFKAQSVAELWRRWHMTLGRWMRDYVYFPLAAGTRSYPRTLLNIIIVFLLIGLWHGASWNMVGWGAYMAAGMVVESLATKAGIRIKSVVAKRALVLLFWVNSGWLFRADSLEMTSGFFRAALGGNGFGAAPDWLTLLVVLACVVHAYASPNVWEWKWRFNAWEAVALATMFVACLLRMFLEKPFFYFQF